MSSISLGPLAISIDQLWLLLALIGALIAGRLASRGRRPKPTDALFGMALAGLIGARLVFVLRYRTQYADHPLGMIDIRDGGFDVTGGLLGMAFYASFKVWRQPVLRQPLGVAVLCGALVWGATGGASALLGPSRPARPDVDLTTLDGQSTSLKTIAVAHPHQPMVVNLWASWCPPCRAEMPMLAKAQAQHSDVTFVFANQGESAHAAHKFLSAESLGLGNVLLDGSQQLARSAGVQAFPTTLFYDADGRLVDQHMGMLSRATLSRALKRVTRDTSNSSQHPKEMQ